MIKPEWSFKTASSLRRKWLLHLIRFLHKSTFILNKLSDGTLRTMMIVGFPFAFLWLCGVVIPSYHSSVNWTVVCHVTAAVYILVNIFWNMFLVIRTKSSKCGTLPAGAVEEDWVYCARCQRHTPPRSYHCTNCNDCIQKRDHHCNFTGCCIGYHNHRYFLVALFYIWLGAVYGVLYEWNFFCTTLNAPHLGYQEYMILLLIPYLGYSAGLLSLHQYVVVQLHQIGCFVLIYATLMLTSQLFQISGGFTMYEWKYDINSFSQKSLVGNFREVLGARMFAAWFLPFIHSCLPGDGTRFVERKSCRYKGTKLA